MPFDGIFIKHLVSELNETLTDSRIDKIHQPENDEITIFTKSKSGNKVLRVSASSSFPRICFLKEKKDNPLSPPMFCMLLRKNLIGGRILSVSQHMDERIINIKVTSKDELGDESEKTLIIEIMGKHSNIILVDQDGKIIDSAKRIPEYLSSVRQILPGLEYKFPPGLKKQIENVKDFLEFKSLLEEKEHLEVFKAIYSVFQGISPILSREICRRSLINESSKVINLKDDEIENLFLFAKKMTDISNPYKNPVMIFEGKTPKDFYFMNLENYYPTDTFDYEEYDSFADLIEDYYAKSDNYRRIMEKSTNLRKSIKVRLDRDIKKLSKLQNELLDTEKMDKFKIKGDLIIGNIYRIEKGMNEVELENYYEDNKLIKIKLDIRLSPSENAQKYFKKYNKLKTASTLLVDQISDTEKEIEYLENVYTLIENSTDQENLDLIREELAEEGYVKRKSRKRKIKNKKINPRTYLSEEGYEILVGRNNVENDYLTTKFASKKDIWLHTKIIPGSHVIIRTAGEEPNEDTIILAAKIAAYHSKARQSENVPIDYTIVKNVKKPNGSKPGMVIYDFYNTVYVTPDEKELNKYIK
ncbi:MAG: NFACT RNA binding domain-containing protein [Firmicutes bacterium]|jgi:predicted ribosome quality control (RQC) complex YloA/Tae2 family protein|nr:NFACT RNA binding domain-containing protein [Bacillota bacterium]